MDWSQNQAVAAAVEKREIVATMAPVCPPVQFRSGRGNCFGSPLAILVRPDH